MIRHSAETKEDANWFYEACHLSVAQVAFVLDVSPHAVKNWIKSQRSISDATRKISISDEALVLKLWKSGATQKEIAAQTHITVKQIQGCLRRANLSRTQGETLLLSKVKNRQIPVDWCFDFSNPSHLWFAGLIFGDGHIPAHGHSVSLTSGDLDVLEKTQKILKITYKICSAKNSKANVLRIYSKRLADELRYNFGLTNRKFDNIVFPVLEPNLVNHFVRGFMDADGCWSIQQEKTLCLFFYTCSKEFAESLRDLIRTITASKSNIYRLDRPGRSTRYQLSFSGSFAVEIGRWLYKDSTADNRNQRKFDIWNRFVTNLEESAKGL